MNNDVDLFEKFRHSSHHGSGLFRAQLVRSGSESVFQYSADIESEQRPRQALDKKESLSRRLKYLHIKVGDGPACLCAALSILFYGSVFAAVWIVALIIVSILCLYFGHGYLGTCPVAPGIKNMLIILGGCGLAKSAIGILEQTCRYKGWDEGDLEEDDAPESAKTHHRHVCLGFFGRTFALFTMLAFIVTCVLSYTTFFYDYQTTDPWLPAYCDPLLATFSLWLCHCVFITVVLILVLLAVLVQLPEKKMTST